MRATPGANLLVTLEEDSQALEEVVVVGYGMRSRSSLTGSVAGLMVGSSSAATAPLEKLEEQDQKAKEEADNEQLYNELMQLNGLRRNFRMWLSGSLVCLRIKPERCSLKQLSPIM